MKNAPVRFRVRRVRVTLPGTGVESLMWMAVEINSFGKPVSSSKGIISTSWRDTYNRARITAKILNEQKVTV